MSTTRGAGCAKKPCESTLSLSKPAAADEMAMAQGGAKVDVTRNHVHAVEKGNDRGLADCTGFAGVTCSFLLYTL